MNKTIKDYAKLVKESSIKTVLEYSFRDIEKEFDSNFYINLNKEKINIKAEQLDKKARINSHLFGVPYFEKDNIVNTDIPTTAGSLFLKDYVSPFNATINEILSEAGAMMVGKTAMDEFGMGGTGLFSFNGEIRNPYEKNRIIGGSSSGSAYAVATGMVPFATGSDTGDSIRKPASFVGIVGFKPTYGSISRYGLMPYAPSLDTIGFFTNNVDDQKILAEVTFKQDKKDFTSINNPFKYENKKFDKKLKIVQIREIYDLMPEDLKKEYDNFTERMLAVGHTVSFESIDINILNMLGEVYMAISYAEAASTLSNLQGVHFGKREEGDSYENIIKHSRGNNFSKTVKKRMIIGGYSLKSENQDIIFLKAKKIRRIIVDRIAEIYQTADIIVLPPSSGIAPTVSEAMKSASGDAAVNGVIDSALLLANFNGMPSITIPFIKLNNLPIGINLNANIKKDILLLDFAQQVEEILKNKE
ncbi:aspartyl/glutamyl-tRNA amidotransferase subunit A [Spiroplasma sp. TIUS-1]|uniref:amidase family protein n=1 Tax=Spiroplasma sp. TIUS-1 TaxID=216963 RepID=UPI00139947A9|nr:amidase family protein [Spiroplasma sp. TIUS-1]QHX36139.1 aspartyl/glutamyl-tRNA amidotransferase subunit A [Spiroplasma sp. TIUS-1]